MSYFLAYSSHIPTPGGPPSNYPPSSHLGGGPGDNSALSAHVYSPMNITPVTPGAQYAPMSASMGNEYFFVLSCSHEH